MSKGGLLKYFTIEQVVEALQTGAARRHQIYDNFAQARYRGYTERAALFKSALEIFDKWKKENKKS
ncbi:hypothetical protein [Klebsiella pneumoniae]|uniref:hypothetical protein n=1 Tax=Klebsiella pneumoniae TaxID=573 RepID=UPI00115D7CDC|nr:hypothetical protein [Klebsiella pneumoniae]EKZ9596670.1 hypothetical protein [Klebsiella pneumoniae]MCS5850514.1 hypothetical protein [Klebsiella pneumoniae subsp. pneumoniae]MCS6063723.1 hypothetical protein [Klebsiella pneumoniae subsp. pneumoniae]MDW5622846.1 hypothetical protein [Klebsiella pneumoniae]MDW5747333.1 hypothetical protein [Klebsiella pneumoniae]